MKCKTCQRPMTQLLVSWFCAVCDGDEAAPSTESLEFRGFVVLRKDRKLPCEEYVFATVTDAERWRELNGLAAADIRSVLSCRPFYWQPSRGTVRGIILADRLYEIFSGEEPYEIRDNRAHLAKERA